MALHIIATAKQVMDPESPASAYRVDRETKRVVPTAQIPPVINGFDENGLEAALRIKDAGEDVRITVLSAGPSFAMDV
ncbi:MAG: electron transfer flavoprotein subunit beta, partial [Chloroflexi bacterium]|nr:electron transfer flavoprotein subunit beta [Chloroflexota bacterium]